MANRLFSSLAAALTLVGCGSPVPSDMFLTLSVSTDGVAVETSVNGKPNAFLSGDSGSMVTSAPLNKLVQVGANEVSFSLSPIEPSPDAPGFYAKLEISLAGEIVDTMAAGERTMFSRELTQQESEKILNGESITITEEFVVDTEALKAMKS